MNLSALLSGKYRKEVLLLKLSNTSTLKTCDTEHSIFCFGKLDQSFKSLKRSSALPLSLSPSLSVLCANILFFSITSIFNKCFPFKQCVYFDSQYKHYGYLGVSLIEMFFNTELKTKESLTKCNHCYFQIFTHLFKLSNGSTVISVTVYQKYL